MRLLFLTNFYPPAARGGYEMWCQEVAELLGRAGHEVVVVTSRSSVVADVPTSGVRVARELFLEMDIDAPGNAKVFFFDRAWRRQANLATVERWLTAARPDAAMIWGMWNLDRSLAASVERLCGRRAVYYFGDYWPTLPSQWRAFWNAPARGQLAGAGKWLLKKPAERLLATDQTPVLSFPHGLFPSEFMRRRYEESGVRVGRSAVVRGGAATAAYRMAAEQHGDDDTQDAPWKVLVAGRLTPEKGIETALRAIPILARSEGARRWVLTVVGTGEREYASGLQDQAVHLGIGDRVRFAGAAPSSEMPRILREHHMLVFPSIWDEPFGRVLVEAMAARVPVVGTTVGGAGEILRDGETGLSFAPGDAEGLARQLERLAADPALRERLTTNGRDAAVTEFDIMRMAAGIEAYLQEVIREEDNGFATSVRDHAVDTVAGGR